MIQKFNDLVIQLFNDLYLMFAVYLLQDSFDVFASGVGNENLSELFAGN